jgi:hypothetical protein
MSNGAVFTLLANVGNQDRLLTAHEYLKNRINRFITEREPNITEQDLLSLPSNDRFLNIRNSILPSLHEIERSHVTFINGSYKPYISIASDYIKVPTPNPKFGETVTFQLPQVGNFTNDCVLHLRISPLYAIDPRDRVHYVAMLGHKLIEHVKFLVNNGTIVDEYTTDDYNAYYQYEVKENHKIGWLRGIGQEIPQLGYITSDPQFDMHREYRYIGNGNQTLKQFHQPIDLFIPLLFFFNNIKTPLNALPWGQTQIEIRLASAASVIGSANMGGGGLYNVPDIQKCDLYCNNLFVQPEIFNLYAKKFVFSIIRVHKHHKEIITSKGDNKYEILLRNLKWPTESLYFSFRPRENLSLSQYWYKNVQLIEQTYQVPVVSRNPNVTITGTMLIDPNNSQYTTINGALIASNTSVSFSSANNSYYNYDIVITSGFGFNAIDIQKNRHIIKSYIPIFTEGIPVPSSAAITINDVWGDFTPNANTIFEIYTPQLAINNVTYYQETPVVDNISLEVNGIELFKSNAESFYNNYLSGKFTNIATPEDRGLYLMSFCLDPNNHQPSGSINISLCREIYLRFYSQFISKNYPVDVIVLAKTINFLLIDKNNAIGLKYNL